MSESVIAFTFCDLYRHAKSLGCTDTRQKSKAARHMVIARVAHVGINVYGQAGDTALATKFIYCCRKCVGCSNNAREFLDTSS